MPISESKKKGDAKWRKNNYDRLSFMIRKDAEINVSVIRRYAKSKNLSVNGLLRSLLEERIRNDANFVI